MSYYEIKEKVDEYCKMMRHPELPEYEFSEIYSLYPKAEEFGWPMCWPHNQKSGIYFILDKDKKLIYIGESNRIGNRLSSYFRYDDDKKCFARHTWVRTPYFLFTLAVPDNYSFERLSLEAFLINNLNPENNIREKEE